MRLSLELPDGQREILVEHEEILTEILRRAGIPLNTRCGQRGICQACSIETQQDGAWMSVKACQCRLRSDLNARIPAHALLAYAPQVISNYRIGVSYACDPLFGKAGVAFAIDIGTTTVSVSLIDLATGETLSITGGFNRQIDFGDNVLTRINLCLADPDMIERLRAAVIEETITPLAQQALDDANRTWEEVQGYVLAGNTVMLHLATRTDPSSMGMAPFKPVFIDHKLLEAGSIGLRPANAPVHCLPGAAAYIGADITAGVLATGLAYEDGPSMLVDVGTNGEIVLKLGNALYGCATAAGPAFEGSGLTCGVRAGEGAISHIGFQRDPFAIETEIIGPPGTKPIGICGSAYIDLLASAREIGLLTESGRFLSQALPGSEPCFIRSDHGLALKIADGRGRQPIVISEADIAKLLQAKAAIAAGISTLLHRVELQPSDIQNLHLAGGFGMHLDIRHTIACGLIPGFKPEQIQLVGNTSLAGAFLALIDASVLPEIARVGQTMQVIELNQDPDFEDTYIDHLSLQLAT